MKMNLTLRGALAGVRRHPLLATAVCVPVIAASVFTGGAMASANSVIPSLAVSSAELHAAPAQHVLVVDNKMAGQVVTHVKSIAPHDTWNIDGCDHDYGAPNVCVPWKVPGATAQAKCAWLRSNGFSELKVGGRNRQDLTETTKHGVAYVCA